MPIAMYKMSVIFALVLTLCTFGADAPPSYEGMIKLPLNMYSAEGSSLEKGEYEMEVKLEKGSYNLTFLQKEQIKASVKGDMLREDYSEPPAEIPLVGTHYLRSSLEPVGTEAERHSVKTGRAQYEEESRNWTASLRIYVSADKKEAVFLFKEKQPRGRWNTVQFKLFMQKP